MSELAEIRSRHNLDDAERSACHGITAQFHADRGVLLRKVKDLQMRLQTSLENCTMHERNEAEALAQLDAAESRNKWGVMTITHTTVIEGPE